MSAPILALRYCSRFGTVPLTARWEYEAKMGTEAGSAEKKLLEVLKQPVEWV